MPNSNKGRGWIFYLPRRACFAFAEAFTSLLDKGSSKMSGEADDGGASITLHSSFCICRGANSVTEVSSFTPVVGIAGGNACTMPGEDMTLGWGCEGGPTEATPEPRLDFLGR